MPIDSSDPFQTHPQYDVLLSRLDLVDDLRGGSRTMRQPKWLPMYAGEDDEFYTTRLALVRCAPLYRKAIQFHADRVFEQPVGDRSGATLPARWDELRRDIDGRGNTLDAFAYTLFQAGEHHGIVHVLADAGTSAVPNIAGRGFLRIITARQLVNWSRDGSTLDEIRIAERDENGREMRRIIRVPKGATSGEWELHRKGGEGGGELIDSGSFEFGRIPLTTWRLDPDLLSDEDPFVSESFLQDVADINLQHLHSMAVQDIALEIARRPKYGAFGFEDDWQPTSLAGSMLAITSKTDASFVSVQESTAPLELGFTHLDRLQEEAALITGQSLLEQRPGTRTATEKALETAEASCAVQRLANDCAEALNAALRDMAEWGGVTLEGDAIELNQDVGINLDDGVEHVWRLATEFGVAPPRMRKLLLDEYRRRNIVSSSTDVDGIMEEADELAERDAEDDRIAQDAIARARKALEQGDDTETMLEGLRRSGEV